MFELPCPSCGAPLRFSSPVSLFATCEHCRTQSLRSDEGFLENLGKVAELQEDSSPLRLGTTGTFLGKRFSVVGRLQLHYARGFWNEWYVVDEHGAPAWIGEAQGTYSRLVQLPLREVLSWNGLEVGEAVTLAGERFVVADKQMARCVSGEGELPFRVRDGYDAPVVDLRTPALSCATLDFSEDPPLAFVGQFVEFDAFAFQNLWEFEGWTP